MTEQYQTEDINGQPSPLSLALQTSGALAAGTIDNAAIYFVPGAGLSSIIVGNGLSLALSSPAVGTIVSITHPGQFRVDFTTADLTSSGVPINILLSPTVIPITTGNGYPVPDYFSLPNVIAVNALNAGPPIVGLVVPLGATFRVTPADLENAPFGGPNIRLSTETAVIPNLSLPVTRLNIQRVSL